MYPVDRSHRNRVIVSCGLVALLFSMQALLVALAVELQPMTALDAQPRIANGLNTTVWPTVVSIQRRQQSTHWCSGVLIGCRTVLSAAHCFCSSSSGDDGARCQPGNNGGAYFSPDDLEVFFQNAPPMAVAEIHVPDDFEFAVRRDVAVVVLSAPVDGLLPSRLNTLSNPVFGTTATLVGFGQSDQRVSDYGIKRQGEVSLASCNGVVPQGQHLCWNFPGLDDAGEPGSDSNTCPGDSGGPMFVDLGAGPTVAGITSGGIRQCQTADTAFDADVYANLDWIQSQRNAFEVGEFCGVLPEVGSATTTQFAGEGRLNFTITEARYSFTVAADTSRLRVALNGDHDVNLDLQVRPLSPSGEALCVGQNPGVFEFCEFEFPQPGTWEVVVSNISREDSVFQVVSTLFGNTFLFRDAFEGGTDPFR